jgi:hypothetical protein
LPALFRAYLGQTTSNISLRSVKKCTLSAQAPGILHVKMRW